ncbi:Chromosome segregation ATPase [Prevotella sp. tc2-28]|uniref:hypothetical protein n=1 Tax=Prevotella sp. tc2-28 TaxID=1761888 RepID=UPI0008982201|nr:hypothetical protein [Prevotella sp. tc2-28]SEA79389.1 Chromosome segregation ATPase [Prevotella sp. tc2-28]
MAANDEILGISGHLDISDIDRSINEMINNLDKIGIKTDALSKRVSDAMREIAQSTDDSATKQKRAMEVFAQATEEAKAALANYPEQIRLAKEAMQQTESATANLEKELAKLNTQLSGSVIGSEKYNQLKTSIAGVEQQIHNNTNAYQAQYAVVQQMEAGYNGLVSMLGVANVSTAANAVAHGAVTAATVVEAGAHAANASEMTKETEATKENVESKKQLTAAQKEAIDALQPFHKEIESINQELSKDGDIQKAIQKYDELIAKIQELYNAENAKTTNFVGEKGERREEWNEYITSADYVEAQQKAVLYSNTLNELRDAKARLLSTTEQVSAAQNEENQSSQSASSSFKEQWNAVNELHNRLQNLKKEHASLQEEYDKLAEKQGFDQQSKKAQELLEKINNLKKEIADTKKEMSEEGRAGGYLAKWKNSVVDAITRNGKFQDSLGNMKTALSGLVAPFTAATGGAVAFTKALWAMAATPIGAVLSAIVLALQAIFAWFKKDAEGQRAFAKITAYLGSLLSSLMDIAVKIGKYLYHAFADPQGALNQFGKGLIGLVINPLKAVAKTLSGVGQIAKGVIDLIASGANVAEAKKAIEGIKNGWEDLKKAGTSVVDTLKSGWDTLAGAAKGTVKLLGEGISQGWSADLGAIGADMFGRAKKAAQLAEQELNAQKALSEAKVKEKQLEIDIAREREKIYTLTGKEKDAQIELVKNMLKEKYDGQIKAQKELLRITKERNALHTMSIESYAKEREAQGAVYALEAQRAASTRMLVRMQQSNLKAMANAGKKDARQQQQIDESEARLEEIIHKNVVARAKAEQDMEQRITDARIAAMKDGADKVLAEKNRSFEKELEQLAEQRKAAIEAERARQKAEFEAQEKIIKARGGKPEQWDETKLDQSAINAIKEQYKKLEEFTIARQQNNELQQQIQSMREYLIEYGTFQQQKLAITEKYAKMIAKAEALGLKGEVLRLKAEENSKKNAVNMSALQQSIDWQSVLGGFTNLLGDQLRTTLEKLRQYVREPSFAKKNEADQKVVYDAITKLKGLTGEGRGTLNFSSIKKQMDSLGAAINRLQQAKNAEITSTEHLEKAKERYKKALDSGNKAEIENAKISLDLAEKVATAASESVRVQQTAVQNLANGLRESEEDTVDGLNLVADGLRGFADNTLSGAFQGIQNMLNGLSKLNIGGEVGKAVSKLSDTLSNAGFIGQLISAILSILDILKDGIGTLISNLIDTVLNAVAGILDNVLSLDFVGQITGSLTKGIGNILNAVTFGGFDSWFGSKDTRAQVDAEIKASNTILESIDKSVKRISDEMSESYGASALSKYEDLLEKFINKSAQYNRQIQEAGWGYYGRRHREWYYRNENGGEGEGGYVWRIRNLLGLSEGEYGTAWQGLFEQLSKMGNEGAKKLAELRRLAEEGNAEAAELWFQIANTGWDDEGRISKAANAWADLADEMEEASEKLSEIMLTTSFDSLFDDMINHLYDYADGVEDVTDSIAESWQKMVNRMLINNLVAQNLKDQLKVLYDTWYKSVSAANANNDKKALQEANDAFYRGYQSVIDSGISQIEQLRELGIDRIENARSQQSATANSIQNISYDQADSLVGIGLNHTILLEQTLSETMIHTELLTDIGDNIRETRARVVNISEGVQSMVETQGLMNSHLAEISENTRVLPEMYDEVVRMRKKIDEQ